MNVAEQVVWIAGTCAVLAGAVCLTSAYAMTRLLRAGEDAAAGYRRQGMPRDLFASGVWVMALAASVGVLARQEWGRVLLQVAVILLALDVGVRTAGRVRAMVDLWREGDAGMRQYARNGMSVTAALWLMLLGLAAGLVVFLERFEVRALMG